MRTAPTRLLAAALILGFLGCGKQPAPPAAQPPAAQKPLAPWSWYPLGSIAVIEGEVAQPAELVLKGRYIHETMDVESGPVRWEIHRPPKDEVAILCTGDGKVLARFAFSTPTPRTPPQPAGAARLPASPKPSGVPSASPARPEAPEARSTDSRRPKPGIAVPEPAVPRPEPKVPAVIPRAAPPPPAPRETETPKQAEPPRQVEVPRTTEPRPRVPEPLPSLPPTDDFWPGSGSALNLVRGPQGGRRIALTFDGGANAESAREILDVLRERRLRCTFFLTGGFIRAYPDLVLRMSREGHEIGNHTLSHPHFAPNHRRSPAWTRERVQQELLAADQLLLRLTGRPMEPLWRAPYGEHTAEIRRWAEELGYRHVGWSEGADTLDWATERERKLYRTGEAILARLHSRMQQSDGDGLVVLMHLGSDRPEADRPARQLRAFMDRAAREGWSFVTVGDYVKELGKPAWNASRRVALLEPHSPASGGPGRR